MKLMLIALSMFFSMTILADVNQQGGACSKTTKVCVAFSSEIDFNSAQEGRFKLYVDAREEMPPVILKIDLWMQMGHHGHGSSPLKVTQVGEAEYDVTKAFFVMKGEWQIRVKYRHGSFTETLIIPVMIKE